MEDLLRLQDSSAQIRVRAAMVLLIAFVALAESLGLEVILGAFAAGGILSLLDQDKGMTHENFRAGSSRRSASASSSPSSSSPRASATT